MKRLFISILFACVVSVMYGQDYRRPKISFDRFGDGLIDVYVENENYYPVQMQFTLTELINMEADVPMPYIATIEQGKHKLFLLRRIDVDLTGNYDYKVDYLTGAYPVVHDSDFVYQLPVLDGHTTTVSVTDHSKNGLSIKKTIMFKIENNDTVCASRGGTVCQIIKPREVKGMMRGTNAVVVLHSDNTFGKYDQLANESFMVKLGDKIEAGTPIALAGHEGGNHIVFSVYHLNAPIDRVLNEHIRDYQDYILPYFKTSTSDKILLTDDEDYQK